jgi:hypothetical protein
MENARSAFHILTAGYDSYLIGRLWNRVQEASGFTFSHLLHPWVSREELAAKTSPAWHPLRESLRAEMPAPDTAYLASLERPGVPTIHNMIMGDARLRPLPYPESLAYASHMARRMKELFSQIKPSVIVSGFDGFHSSMAMAVARSLDIPFFTISFTSIPTGLTGFGTGMNTATVFSVRRIPDGALHSLAEQTLSEFESLRLVAPTIQTEVDLATIVGRFPRRVRSLYRASVLRSDKFTRPSIGESIYDYVRRRWNLVRLPRKWLIDTPPDSPYMFIGLHMQPEMAIDVWAPFYSDQFHVIETIARSMPPTHRLMVKLHKIDADNYSRAELERLRRLPGVQLVSPFASSRAFLEKAALVFSIEGTITLEAAMLGRPVLAFGETKYAEMPSVSMVKRVTDLPEQIRSKLSEPPPARESIVRGLMGYLGCYAPGIYNDWDVLPPDHGIKNLSMLFDALRDFVQEAPRD